MVADKKAKSLGGYQGLELPFYGADLDKCKVKTNSARSALRIILSELTPKKIWLPAYTCDAVVQSVEAVGIEKEYYRLTSSFDVDASVRVGGDECILIVDYFGLSGDAVCRGLNRFGHRNTIVDCSQAYFSEYSEALATIYSPRKFFGLPDGGLLFSDDPRIKQPDIRDTTSESRMGHLISRITESPEAAYKKYQDAEEAIGELPVQGMSRLTERLLRSVNYDAARVSRTRNAQYLDKKLGEYNKLSLEIGEDIAPLCYPFLPNTATASRAELIKNRVFVPSYWPEVLQRSEGGSFEWDMVTNGLFLPCDQRYTEEDMERLVSLLAIR
ncbi:DegT/DnrJ/EryC1/StrS aminotransferase family protein [Halomonas alimentaria]|uniref:DegT/DnrJ/EryC1/StrS aminotransferase n=1 Tax=Halomonas alimentaria TaxID=147248 RepID=A0A7X5AP27_9GAMM|nr:DegT/DnrJ/EryC1/StrS aminotransferase family protein [Halomonas alimentaria]NAW34715.1 hypothetical protein [Halomonas alimentaria]